MKINEVARKLNISTNKIRFYETQGLIKIKRDANGYRYFDKTDIEQIQLILFLRNLSLSVKQIKQITNIQDPRSNLDILFDQYSCLNNKISKLNQVRKTLEELIDEYLENQFQATLSFEKLNQLNKQLNSADNWFDHWNFDNQADYYDELVTQQLPGLDFYQDYQRVLDTTAKFVNQSNYHCVVEIGIGTGNLAKRFDLSKTIYGVDQSREMLLKAKKKCPHVLLKLGTYLQLPFTDNFSDVVVSSYAFHHNNYDEQDLAIKEMIRILKPHGRIIITDLMFSNEIEKQVYRNNCSKLEKEDIDDEYFAYLDNLETIFNKYQFTCKKKQLTPLTWIFIATI